MPPQLPEDTHFEVPDRGKKKYIAVVPRRGHKTIRVGFGHRDYEHYQDQVPENKGGGRWTALDHGDSARRDNYRKRHAGMKCKSGARCIDIRYSPAWFSYYFLW